MYAISEAVKIADELCREQYMQRNTNFLDWHVALKRISPDQLGTGQTLVLRMMYWECEVAERKIMIEYRWVPAHCRIEGNKKGDQQETRVG